MGMFRFVSALVAGPLVLAACASSGAETSVDLAEALRVLDQVKRRVTGLESELAIIEERRVYLLIDAEEEELVLKVAGTALKRIPVHVVTRPDEDTCRGGIAVLSAKTPTKLPSVPSEEGDVNRVRLEEMPVGYRLDLDCAGEVDTLVIAPLYGSRFEKLRAFADRMSNQLREMIPFLAGRRRHILYLSTPGARELYWSLRSGDFAILR